MFLLRVSIIVSTGGIHCAPRGQKGFTMSLTDLLTKSVIIDRSIQDHRSANDRSANLATTPHLSIVQPSTVKWNDKGPSLTHNGRENNQGKEGKTGKFFLRDFEPTKDWQGAMRLAGDDYTVEKQPLHLPDGSVVPDYFACVRSDTGKAQGVVGSGYEVFQPSELWQDVAAPMVEQIPDCNIISSISGALGGSDMVQGIQFDLGRFSPTGDPKDAIQSYASLLQSFDGVHSLKLKGPWGRRAVCENTLAAQVVAFSIKHRKNMRVRVEDIMPLWVGVRAECEKHNKRLSAMTLERITDDESRNLFANLMLSPFERMIGKRADIDPFSNPELPKEGKARTGFLNSLSEFERLLTHETGGGVAPGTKYGTYQALSTWKNHSRTRVTEGRTEEEVRLDSNLFGQGARFHEAAFSILSH